MTSGGRVNRPVESPVMWFVISVLIAILLLEILLLGTVRVDSHDGAATRPYHTLQVMHVH